MTHVLPQTPVLVAEYQVRGTCLDSLGDEPMASDPCDGIVDAHLVLEQLQAHQDRWDLPDDAAIWWRPGKGHAWRLWDVSAEAARLAEPASA